MKSLLGRKEIFIPPPILLLALLYTVKVLWNKYKLAIMFLLFFLKNKLDVILLVFKPPK